MQMAGRREKRTAEELDNGKLFLVHIIALLVVSVVVLLMVILAPQMKTKAGRSVTAVRAKAEATETDVPAWLCECDRALQQPRRDASETTLEEMTRQVNETLIENGIRTLAGRPSVAGTAADYEDAQLIKSKWQQSGLDRVDLVAYEVMLSFPNGSDPSSVSMQRGNETVWRVEARSERSETAGADSLSASANLTAPFIAYSRAGTVVGQAVYANYGTLEDLLLLQTQMHVELSEKVLIIRYGKIARSLKVAYAAQFAASGVILYHDPLDYAFNGSQDAVYPHSWWLPNDGVQRGYSRLSRGDPQTPHVPSKSYAFRRAADTETDTAPIVVHPIGYKDAEYLLKNLTGPVAPANWQGGFPFSYHIGPSFRESDTKIRLRVTNFNKMATIYNVIGTLQGSVEPDRYVLMGSHKDTWANGAMDARSGTAVQLELVRVLGAMKRSGWRPRRTIVFCSWSGHEFAMLGSTEFMEEHMSVLHQRAVAYLNVDIAVTGDQTLSAQASPLLYNLIDQAAKQVPHPAYQNITLYDAWIDRTLRRVTHANRNNPMYRIGARATASDFEAFIFGNGIPFVNFCFTHDEQLSGFPAPLYPLYHTGYDNFRLMKKFVDPNFKFHKSVAQLSLVMLKILSDDAVLAFDPVSYADMLEAALITLKSYHGAYLSSQGVSLAQVESAIEQYTDKAVNFHPYLVKLRSGNISELKARMLNDQLMLIERSFLLPESVWKSRPLQRHTVLLPSLLRQPGLFAGLMDCLFIARMKQKLEAHNLNFSSFGCTSLTEIKHQIELIVYSLQSAARALRRVEYFGVFAP